MQKSRTNFIIDAIMFLTMMALTGTGWVRKYILLSGSASRSVYGHKLNMTLIGFNRDDWAVIHLYLGYFLLFLLILHIYLHWKQITGIYGRWITNNTTRKTITVIFILISLLLLLFPFIFKPVVL